MPKRLTPDERAELALLAYRRTCDEVYFSPTQEDRYQALQAQNLEWLERGR